MTEKSEVVRTLFEYRDELGRRELALLKRMARLWLGVEKEVDQEAAILAQVIIKQAESGQTITPQYVYSLQRYKAFADQAKIEIDYYDKNIIELITKSQLENMNLGLQAANKAILQSYPVSSPSWTQLNISAFETMAGMLGDGTPLSRLISKDYPFAIEQINEALINGVTIGKGYKQIAKDMVEASQMAFERSVLIARTEINRAYRLANTEQYRQSGVVTGFKRLVYKPTACFACLMMDGEVIPVDQELYDHPRGRCSAVPITIGGNTAQWQTGHEWFLELSPEEQRKIMGNTRYEAWKYGQVTDLRDFVYMKPNEIWGPAPAIKNLDQLSIQTIRSFAGKNYFYVPEELSGIFSNKFAEIVYNEAISGGKFSGAYKNFQEQSNKSLDKTIKSLEKRVAEHVEKIITPNKYYKDWLELDEKTKEGIIHNWRSHLEKNKKSLEIAKIVRSERTDKPSE